MIQEDIEDYIITKIFNNCYKSGEKIPKEKDLQKIFNCSKGTIRKAILSLVNKNILISIQGDAVYVSKFYHHHIDSFNYLKDIKLDSYSQFIRLTINHEIPSSVIQNSPIELDFKEYKFLTYIKFIFKDERTISYSINWIKNDKNLNIKLNDLIDFGKTKLFNKDMIYKSYNKTFFIKLNNIDKRIFNLNTNDFSFLPTIFNYYFNKKEELVAVSTTKVCPMSFQNNNVNYFYINTNKYK